MSDKKKSETATGEGAVEQWNRAVREAHVGDDLRDASSVREASDEEVERRLREAGVDLDAEAALADATYEAMLAKHFPHAASTASAAPASDTDEDAHADPAWVATTESNVVAMPKRTTRSAWVVWLIAAALATAGAAYVAGHRHEPPPPPEEPKEEAPTTVTPKPAPPAPVAPIPEPVPEPARPSPKAPH